MFLAGDGDNECNDFTSDDAMLLLDEKYYSPHLITLHCFSDVLVYKYDASILLWCNITVISSALVIVSEITLLESSTVHLPTIYSIIVWPFQTPYCMFFSNGRVCLPVDLSIWPVRRKV